MKIVNRSHSISNSRNISILSDCALVVSLFENDDFSAQVKFYGSNFTDLMKAAGLQKQGATLYELHSENLAYTWFNATLRNFFEESIDDDFYDIFFSVFNYIDFKNGTENLLNEIHSCVVEVGFLSVFRFLSKFRDLVDTFKENRKKFSKPAPFVFGERSISIGKYVHIEGEDYDCLMQQLNALVDDYYDDVVKANSFNIEKRDAKNEIYNLLASDVLLKPENTPEFRISFSKLVMILTTNYYIIS